MKLYKIRCSALPSAFVCPPSVLPAEVRIDPVSPPAAQGSAAHEVMDVIVTTDANSIDGIDIPEIARKWDADAEELKIQAFVGLKVWKRIRDHFPGAQAEVELVASFDLGDDVTLELTGHLDVLALMRAVRKAKLGDWKFGRVDRAHGHQVKGYMALALANYDEVNEVEGYVAWMLGENPAEPDIEPYSMNRDQLWEWLDEVKKRIVNWDGVYHPGEQCTYCPRNTSCAALTAMARRDVLVLGDPEMAERVKAGLQDLTDRELIALKRRGKVVAKMIEGIDAALRERVEALGPGGALSDGDGREFRFVESARRVLAPALARAVLAAHLTTEELDACTKYSLSDASDAVAARAERGKKKIAIEELGAALEAAGAVSEEKTKRLMDMREKG
jgi:hypothetical protein